MRTPFRICLLLAFYVGCAEKPHPVSRASPPPTVEPTVAAVGRGEAAEWADLLALASRLDRAGVSEFKSHNSTVLALRDVLVRDLDGDAFKVPFALPEPVYQPPLDLHSIPRKWGSLAPGVVKATIDATGSVVGLTWWRKTDFPEVNLVAEDTIRRWRYRPAVREGRFAAAEVVITIRF